MLEGAFVPLNQPVSNAIQAQIGVDKPFPPFVVSATAPATASIYVLSDAAQNFDPVQQINCSTVVVNGIPFPDAQIFRDPVDERGDGIPDAIVVVSPRSALNLAGPPAATSLNFQARTNGTGPNANLLVTGSAAIQVAGIPQPPNPPLAGVFDLCGFLNPNAAVPPFGERAVPQEAILSKLNWKPLSTRVAYRQFRPPAAFQGRYRRFFHGSDAGTQPLGSKNRYTGYKTSTLGRRVFTRSRFKTNGLFDARTFIRNES